MPAYTWLAENVLKCDKTADKMRIFKNQFGVPYTDEQIANAKSDVENKTEMDAIIAYLQSLGLAMK